jgi:hypothetical protein
MHRHVMTIAEIALATVRREHFGQSHAFCGSNSDFVLNAAATTGDDERPQLDFATACYELGTRHLRSE